MMRFAAPSSFALICCLMLWSCAETNLVGHMVKSATSEGPPPSATTGSVYKIGKPYQVSGVWYYPREDFDYDESGIASWYGPDFHGKLTANGEVFDQNTVSAAHKTLPLPTIVRVTNLENGRSLVIRINDRGPFVNGRIIDLSKKSAQLLGIDVKGTAKVRVQVMAEESHLLASGLKSDNPGHDAPVVAAPRESVAAESLKPPSGTRTITAKADQQATQPKQPALTTDQKMAAAAQAVEGQIGQVGQAKIFPTNIFVQAGTFAKRENAQKLQTSLAAIGHVQIQQVNQKGQSLYKVKLGPMATPEDADKILDRVIAAGQQDAREVVE
jgi:rare lipoprotein A